MDGDKAKGTLVRKSTGKDKKTKTKKEPIEFVKIKDSWYVIPSMDLDDDDGKEEKSYEVQLATAGDETREVKLKANGEVVDTEADEFTSDFAAEKADLASVGRNPYFILEPGYQLVLEGGTEELTITVLDETKQVDGVDTRVVEERETKDGKLAEVS